MEDRDLQNRKSNRRKRRIKRKKNSILLKRILLALIVILFFYLIVRGGIYLANKYMNNSTVEEAPIVPPVKEKEEGAGQEKASVKENKDKENKVPSLSLDKDKSKAKKEPVDTNITSEGKMNDLEDRINDMISNKEINKELLSVSFFNVNNNESKMINPQSYYKVEHANDFMIAMDVYAVVEDNSLELDDLIDIVEANSNAENDNSEKKIPRNYSINGLIELMIKSKSNEARATLIKFIEDQTSKNWFDDINSRYGISISYKNEMNIADATEMLRALFEQRKLSVEERKELGGDIDRVYKYQDLINMMTSSSTNTSISRDIIAKGQFGEGFGNDYSTYTSMGFVLKDPGYVYVIISDHNDKSVVYDTLKIINDWHNYYNN